MMKPATASRRILLISANPNYPAFVSPYGLEVLAAALTRHLKAEVRIADPFLEPPFTTSLPHLIAKFRPHLVGIGMRNLDIWFDCNPLSQQITGRTCVREVAAVAHAVKSCGIAAEKILVGGAGFSIAPVPILRQAGLPYGIVGPGGWGFVEFARMHFEGGTPSSIPGLVCHDDEFDAHPRPGPTKTEYDLDLVPQSSALHRMLLRRRNLPFPLRTQSGCGHGCSFCCEGHSQSRPARARALASIGAELQQLKREKATRIMLADGEFNRLSFDHTKAVIRLLRQHRLSWRAYALPDRPTDELLALLRDSRCESLLLTIDSASAQVLNRIGRPTDAEQLGVTLERYLAYGIDVQASLIFGLPGESYRSIDQTLELVRAFPSVSFNYSSGARIYANTPLFEQARRSGAKHVYGAGTADPLGISLYSEPAPPWEIEMYLRERLNRATNLIPLWAPVERPAATLPAMAAGTRTP